MKIFTRPAHIPAHFLNHPVVTWGIFDGMHRGHQQVLRRVVEWARKIHSASMVITFDPHPVRVLTGKPVSLLSTLERRLDVMASLGVDLCLVIRFTPAFARTSAEEFIRTWVVDRFHAHRIVLGHDSMFGRDREGDLRLLKVLSRELGLEIRSCRPVRWRGEIVSSSLIRARIGEGDLKSVRAFMGSGPYLEGVVVRGSRRGRTLGFPTANLDVRAGVVPPRGVYAVHVMLGGRRLAGAVNIGVRPTFQSGPGVPVVEVHILDFQGGNLYRKKIGIEFMRKIREERKFEGAEDLKRQIRSDISRVRRIAATIRVSTARTSRVLVAL